MLLLANESMYFIKCCYILSAAPVYEYVFVLVPLDASLFFQVADVFLQPGVGLARMWRRSSLCLEELDQKQKDPQ